MSLIVPAFIAGVLTFLAPCSLPLVPGYLAFIGGVSFTDLNDPEKAKRARRKIFLNGVFYVIGFSVVFIIFGSLFGLGGAALIHYRVWLSRIGGAFIILFGLFMMGFIKIPALLADRRPTWKHLTPGNPVSSLIFGATFAFGWSPCIGPILGSVLLLASTRATVGQGAFLLAVFALGLALPFLVIALGIGSATSFLKKLNRFLPALSIIGGLFLIFLGILILTNTFGVWVGIFYRWFSVLNYDRLLEYL